MTLSKKMMNVLALENTSTFFRCPICKMKMTVEDKSRLVCSENHSFDVSKNGYINLAPQAHVTKYDKSLFEARKKIIESGFFNPLLQYMTEVVTVSKAKSILDAGCGEGSHLAEVLSQLPAEVHGVGIDLAKEGVATAAKTHPGISWCVADLANCPFENAQFDAIFNVLSPANYTEFRRLLHPDGLLIKVVPESNYLKELRALFYEEKEPKEESNPVERFSAQFDLVSTKRITYEFPLNRELLEQLIRMTPLSWGASEEKLEEATSSDIPVITIDYLVMVGKKGDSSCSAVYQDGFTL
ncbi:methyltransferase domain-containing protein [Sporosarcina sp. CAU 1771]